jgi:thiamine pyrophosphate-dependent acetolactate synthase large subunit-like protein
MNPTSTGHMLDRRDVVARLVRDRGDLAVISSLGSPTYDLAAAGDHDRNFYLWGAMGGAIAFGLGLALAKPNLPVLVLAGDGECLMGIGSFATIGVQQPPNLSVVVLDNGLYGETGSQRSHTSGGITDLAAVATACGVTDTMVVGGAAGLEALAARVVTVGAGPLVAIVRIDGASKPRCLPSRDGVMLKGRFRQSLGYPSM